MHFGTYFIPMNNTFLLGTHIYPAKEDALKRMSNAIESWRILEVPLVNMAFCDEPSINPPGFEELRCLKRDSNTVTGGKGIRKPLMLDLFDGLCETARRNNCSYFVFTNSDIQLTTLFRDLVSSCDLDSLIFTRLDYNESPDSHDSKLFFRGQDTYAVRTDWWCENRHHFRSYIIGEALWDNVYTSKFARLGRSRILYEKNLCNHQRHEQKWNPGSLFGRYNEMLRLRYDYLDYGMWSLYIKQLFATDRDSDDFPTIQEQLWKSLSEDKPTPWIKTKNLVAYPLSFIVGRNFSRK
jgi:hypothetical protein